MQYSCEIITICLSLNRPPEYLLKHHIPIWKVSPNLSCRYTCYIWTWFNGFNKYFCKIKKLYSRWWWWWWWWWGGGGGGGGGWPSVKCFFHVVPFTITHRCPYHLSCNGNWVTDTRGQKLRNWYVSFYFMCVACDFITFYRWRNLSLSIDGLGDTFPILCDKFVCITWLVIMTIIKLHFGIGIFLCKHHREAHQRYCHLSPNVNYVGRRVIRLPIWVDIFSKQFDMQISFEWAVAFVWRFLFLLSSS